MILLLTVSHVAVADEDIEECEYCTRYVGLYYHLCRILDETRGVFEIRAKANMTR